MQSVSRTPRTSPRAWLLQAEASPSNVLSFFLCSSSSSSSEARAAVSAIPITLAPEEQPQGDKPRKRTVREAGHGTDILNRCAHHAPHFRSSLRYLGCAPPRSTRSFISKWEMVRGCCSLSPFLASPVSALSKTKGMARAFEAAAPVPPVTRPSVSTSLPPMPVNQPAAAPTQVHVACTSSAAFFTGDLTMNAAKPAPKFVMGQRPAATGNVGAPNISPLRPSV